MPEDDIQPFLTLDVSRAAYRMADEGRPVIHMEFGQPSTGAPKAAIAAAHRVLDSDPMGYWESVPLKARLSRHYEETYGLDIAAERFILTCGASPALVLALTAAFRPGARIALARPGYVAYRNTIRALGMVPVEIPCGAEARFQLSAAALSALDPAPDGVIVASPANPTGTILPEAELRAIAGVCRARRIRIVSDEIYHGLSYIGPTPSILQCAPDALVINGFSKYFSMVGWRLGWLVAPENLRHKARALMSNLFLTPPSLSQHAALVAMDAREDLQTYAETYARNRQLLIDALPALGLNRIAPPDGAFYIYADIGHLTDDSPILDSLAFCHRMLAETGVAAATGRDFDPVDGGRFIRFSFAVSTEETREAIRRLTDWFAR
ncbi:MAG TPA: aminotransferase class I/II-fold pyridoxal phosphate-dependent enzyme [Asticcacaulis sp.]